MTNRLSFLLCAVALLCQVQAQDTCVTQQEAIHVTDNTDAGRQWHPIVRKLADNRLVVAWEDLGTGDNMFRVYGSDVAVQTGATSFGRSLTMQDTWGWKREDLRALPSGGFIMLVNGADFGGQSLTARFQVKIFDAALNEIHTTIYGMQLFGEPSRAIMEPKIVLFDSVSEGFMVTFRIGDCGLTWSCHAAQIFDATATPVGEWFYVDGRVRGGDERNPAILNLEGGPWSSHVTASVSLANGNVLLIHAGQNAESYGTTIGSIWNQQGQMVKAHFLLPDVVANRIGQSDAYAHAALLSTGNVVVVWMRVQKENADNTGRDQRQLVFQILDQDGNKIGANQQSYGPMESSGDAQITIAGYPMVAATDGKFTILSYTSAALFTRTFSNNGTPTGPIVNEIENLSNSIVSRAVIEYGVTDYVIAIQSGRLDGISDIQDGVFLIGKSCAPSMEPTASPTVKPSLTPTMEPTSSTMEPTSTPSMEPSLTPTMMPTKAPTDTLAPPMGCDSLGSTDEFKFTFKRACGDDGWSSTCVRGFAVYDLNGVKIDLQALNPVVTDTGRWVSGAHAYVGEEILEGVGLGYCSEPIQCTPTDDFEDEIVTIKLDQNIDFSSFDLQQTDKLWYRPAEFTLEIMNADSNYETVLVSDFDLSNQEIRNFANTCACDSIGMTDEFKFTFKRACIDGWSAVCMDGFAVYDVSGVEIDLQSLNVVVTDTGGWRSGARTWIGQDILRGGIHGYCSETMQCTTSDVLDDEIVTIRLDQPVAFSSFDLQQSSQHQHRPEQFTLDIANSDGSYDTILVSDFDLMNRETRNYMNTCPCDSLGTASEFKFTFKRACVNGWSSTCMDGFALYDVTGAKIDLHNMNSVVTDTGRWVSGAHAYVGGEILEGVGLAYCSEPIQCTTSDVLDDEIVTIQFDERVAFSSFDLQQADKLWYRPEEFTLEILTSTNDYETVLTSDFDLGNREIRNFANTCASPSMEPSLSPTMEPTVSPSQSPTTSPIMPTPSVCEKQGQCVNSDGGAVFATMTAGVALTKAQCIEAFEACDDAAGASFRTSSNTCQIFGEGGLPSCAAISGWQSANVLDTSTGPITSTTGTDPAWADVICFSPDVCASVCEMEGQCQNSHFSAVFPTMTARHELTKEECIQFFQACGDASSASYRASTQTCQIFGNGALPTCAAVTGWQPGNVGDRGSGPVTTTTGNAAPWNGVACFSEHFCAPPSMEPSLLPTMEPTMSPSPSPTPAPTQSPSPSPTPAPTQSPSPSPTTAPTQSPTTSPVMPTPSVCEKQGQCVNSNGGAVFATMTARVALTKAQCIEAFEACDDAAGGSFRTSTNTCQIFGEGSLPACAAVSGWQPGNALDTSTGPITSTTGTAAPWADVICFSPDMCAPPVCEMQGQCQNSNFHAVFPTMTAQQVLTKEECVQFFQACGDASSASYRASTHTCQIFGNGALPTCAAVAGWQPGNVGDRGSGPVTTTTGNAAPWNGVTCFSENLCDSAVQLQMTIKGWTQAQFDAHRDEIIATIATTLGLSSSQVQVSLGRLGWLRRNLSQGLTIYVRIKAQNDQMPTINSNLAQVPADLGLHFPPAKFETVNTETKTVAEAQVTASICPAGTIERVGASFDGSWVTYTDTIEDCLTACDLQTPNHGQLPPRDCNAIMWSPTVRAGTKGQCWRFETAAPELTSRHSDYTYCERVGAEGEIMDSGLECNPGNAITTEDECKEYAAALGITFSWVGIVHAPGGCYWHHNIGMSGDQITNIGFNSDLTDNGSGWGGVGRVCSKGDVDVFVSNGDRACPARSETLGIDDCHAAADTLGINYWGSSPSAPIGCWKYVNPVNGATHVFANNVANPEPSRIQWNDIAPICRPTAEDSNALGLLGAGRCKSNGNIVPLGGSGTDYTLKTPKDKCLADCEADANCVAAMPAYNYYCQLFKTTDVRYVDDFASNYQTQWECYAKTVPDEIVTMQMKAQGMNAAQFAAQKGDLTASLASSLGVPAGRVELSLTPFQRRALSTSEQGLDIYARVRALESEMASINEKTSDPDALAREISTDEVTFEVTETESQAFALEESPSTDPEVVTEEGKTEGVSTGIFVLVALICLVVGLGLGMAVYRWSVKEVERADADLEVGGKRIPTASSQPDLKREISLQGVDAVTSNGDSVFGGTGGKGNDSLRM